MCGVHSNKFNGFICSTKASTSFTFMTWLKKFSCCQQPNPIIFRALYFFLHVLCNFFISMNGKHKKNKIEYFFVEIIANKPCVFVFNFSCLYKQNGNVCIFLHHCLLYLVSTPEKLHPHYYHEKNKSKRCHLSLFAYVFYFFLDKPWLSCFLCCDTKNNIISEKT